MAKREYTRIITPAFVAGLVFINKPSERYNNYTIVGKFDPKNTEHRKFLSQLKKLHTAAVESARAEFKPTKKVKELTINDAYTQDDDSTLYSVSMNEKATIEWVDKKTGEKKTASMKPAIVDANGQTCDVEVWGGSTLKAAVDVSAYLKPNGECGISLKPRGVQVIKLVTRKSRDLGFGKVEGGFDSSNFMPAEPSTSGTDDSDDDFDDEFNSDVEEGGETAAPAAEGDAAGSDEDFDF